MKKSTQIHKLLSVALSAIMLLSVFHVVSFAATTPTSGNFEYSVSNNEVTITRYAGEATAEAITVPDEINGNPVTAIGDGAFVTLNAISITLPKTITKIGMMAFLGSTDAVINLAELENLTYIGAYAFVDTALSGNLVIPESVTDIGAGAFSMTDITSLHLGKNVKPVSVQTGNPWTVIVKTVVPGFASLASSFIKPYSSTESERNIAMNCMNLRQITVDTKNPYLRSYAGVLFSKDMTEMYCYPSGRQVQTYIIPLTVHNFYNAFGGLHLPSASFTLFGSTIDLMDDNGNGLVKLPEWTDFGVNNPLKSVVIPANISSICYAAFYNTGLTNIYIPKNVEIIGTKAFWHCRNLTTVGFDRDSAYTELPEQCFKDCTSLKNITFGRVDYLSKLAFDYCTSIESVDLTNVLSLDSTAFDNCTSLAEVVYGDSDTAEKATVSNAAFEATDSLETVMLGSAVESVEAKAFANCTNLKTAYISDKVESISPTAFDGCENLTITVPTETCYAYQYAKQNNIPVTTLQISPIPNQTYTGTAIEPEITVTQSGRQLTENTDYEVFFKNNTDFGTASVTVVGKGAYGVFAAVAKFAILQRDLDDGVLISNILPQSASENGKEPEIALSCGHYVLQKDIDYTVEYANNTQVGTASVTITGIGNFTGTKTLTFEITDAPPTENVEYMPGDIDGNGEIALTDYALMRNIAIGMMTVTDEAVLKAGDLNGDTVVDFFDVSLMNLKLNGWDV